MLCFYKPTNKLVAKKINKLNEASNKYAY
jgi:hypothetical protein